MNEIEFIYRSGEELKSLKRACSLNPKPGDKFVINNERYLVDGVTYTIEEGFRLPKIKVFLKCNP